VIRAWWSRNQIPRAHAPTTQTLRRDTIDREPTTNHD
jgi:hypothetical protein